MKINKTKETKTAISSMNDFAKTQSLTEAIASASDYSPLLENSDVFDSSSMLDVEISDAAEQPKLFNQENTGLSPVARGSVADEFAKRLMNLKVDTVDLEDLGPITTAIAMDNGLPIDDVNDFITELINRSAEKQDSQAIALGVQGVPGEEQIAAPAPELGGLDAGLDVNPIDAPMDAPLDEPVLDAPVDEFAPVDETPAIDLPVDDVPAVEPIEDKIAEEKEHVEMASDLEKLAKEDENPEAEAIAAKLKAEESEEVDRLEDKVDDEKDIDAKLESIRSNYISDRNITATLESIADKYVKSVIKAVLENETETEPEVAVDPIEVPQENITEIEDMPEDEAVMESEDVIKKALHGIVESYQKLEEEESSSKKDNSVDTFLESLVKSHNSSKKTEKIKGALQALTESYNGKKATSVESRQTIQEKARKRIEDLKKKRSKFK